MLLSVKGTVPLIIFLFIVVGMYFLIIWPNYQGHQEFRRLTSAHETLMLLIEAEDSYYSTTGKYLPIEPSSENIEIMKKLNWYTTSDCSPCEFGVAVSNMAFTATVRCPLDDGTFHYLGYVRTAPGKMSGIDGPFDKCKAEGIFTPQRPLVNKVGPCFKQKKGVLFVVAGNKKTLVVKTFPPNASITANGILIGKTSSHHNTISNKYGSFYWEDPYTEFVTIKVSKTGYHPVEFCLNWDLYPYTAAITLRKIQKE